MTDKLLTPKRLAKLESNSKRDMRHGLLSKDSFGLSVSETASLLSHIRAQADLLTAAEKALEQIAEHVRHAAPVTIARTEHWDFAKKWEQGAEKQLAVIDATLTRIREVRK